MNSIKSQQEQNPAEPQQTATTEAVAPQASLEKNLRVKTGIKAGGPDWSRVNAYGNGVI